MSSVNKVSVSKLSSSTIRRIVRIPARDGYELSGSFYCPPDGVKGALLLEPAMAVGCHFYGKFARWLAKQGYAVLTYDHRGVGDSRPVRMRGFEADLHSWVHYDCAGAADWLSKECSGLEMGFIGHSAGGIYIGLIDNHHLFRSVVTISAQTAYYKDWDATQRNRYIAFFHGIVPLVTQVVGYFPGRFFGLEDIPAGLVKEMHQRRKYADLLQLGTDYKLPFYFDQVKAQLLALGFTDDPIGTPKALERFHALFSQAQVETRFISPAEAADFGIGHFEFFRMRNRNLIWRIVSEWFAQSLSTKPVNQGIVAVS